MTPTGESEFPATATARAAFSRGRKLALLLVALLLGLGLLSLDTKPSVGPTKAPDAQSVTAARGLLKQVAGDTIRRGERLTLRVSQAELDGLGQLSNQALAPLRVKASLVAGKAAAGQADHLLVRISRPLPLGLWVNMTATVQTGARKPGLPEIRAQLGHLPMPQWLTHLVLRRLWLAVQGDSAHPLALDDAIRQMSIGRSRIVLVIAHPGRGAGLAGLARANGAALDATYVGKAYCAIAGHKGSDLSALVRRTWAVPAPPGLSGEDRNRALLTALAMRVVPEYRDRLASEALPLIARCPAPALALTLGGREDLAKHWTLSAALTATLGGQVARSMGAWKELADSARGGSGFSFVDLAADRSGERFAMAAVDPSLASAVSTRLGAVTQAQLLPAELLSKPEGLDQAAFERDYSAIDSPEYKQAIRAIDAVLNNAGVPSP